MSIIRLEIENVKRIVVFSVIPEGNMIILGGKNKNGKTSVLDAIEYALGGKSHICDEPLHRGAKGGHVIVETEDYIVKRTFTKNDSYIEVTTRGGTLIRSPQELLNKLVGDLGFDPLAFTNEKPDKQVEIFMRLLNLDFTDLNITHKKLSEERVIQGRIEKAAKARLDAMTYHKEAPKQEVVLTDLLDQLQVAQTYNQKAAEYERLYQQNLNIAATTQQQIEELQKQLAAAEAKLEDERMQLVANLERHMANQEKDVEPLLNEIKEVEATNSKVRANLDYDKTSKEMSNAAAEYLDLTYAMREIDTNKAQQLSSVKFPIVGVTIENNEILVNGISFSEASSAEQLCIATAMALSSDPKLKIVLIRSGSLLDDDSLEQLAALAKQFGAQVWLERVGTGKEVMIVIEDGMIKENRLIDQKVVDHLDKELDSLQAEIQQEEPKTVAELPAICIPEEFEDVTYVPEEGETELVTEEKEEKEEELPPDPESGSDWFF